MCHTIRSKILKGSNFKKYLYSIYSYSFKWSNLIFARVKFAMTNFPWPSLCRHGLLGGADRGPGEGADGARWRPRSDHHLLVVSLERCSPRKHHRPRRPRGRPHPRYSCRLFILFSAIRESRQLIHLQSRAVTHSQNTHTDKHSRF